MRHRVMVLGAAVLALVLGGVGLAFRLWLRPSAWGYGAPARGDHVLAAGSSVGDGDQYVVVLDLGNPANVLARFRGERPLWSPDGALLAFSRADNRGVTQIGIWDSRTRRARMITTHAAMAWHNSWSPEGDRLYYGTQSGGWEPHWLQVWSVEAATRAVKHLSVGDRGESTPLASPDGKLIAFDRARSRGDAWGPRDVWTMTRDGGNRHRLTTARDFGTERAWSPDGQWVYYTSSEGASSAALAKLAKWAYHPGRPGSREGIARLLGGTETLLSIYRVRPDGAGRQVVVEGHPVAQMARCAPQGGLICYVVPGVSGSADVWVARMDGSAPRKVSMSATHNFGPVWSPDGATLAWLRAGTGPDSGVVVHGLASGRETVVAHNDAQAIYTSVDWRPPMQTKQPNG
ncbi:MAG: hypothetical protein FJX74_24670 [Armatimonadetes bacterium]|nr:hypothetical protein [Armatimonadota bacterium]